MVASSSAGFFSSMTPKGRPLRNRTMSGRRVFRFSVTVNWLTASQSLLSGLSKLMTWAWSPRMDPSLGPVLHVDAVHQHPVEGTVAGLRGRSLRLS